MMLLWTHDLPDLYKLKSENVKQHSNYDFYYMPSPLSEFQSSFCLLSISSIHVFGNLYSIYIGVLGNSNVTVNIILSE